MGRPSAVIVRQESSALQHKDATAREESERLKDGKEECTMSAKRLGKAASPIRGVVAVVAPAGAQITKPVSQSPLEFRDDTESAVARIASTAKRMAGGRMFESRYFRWEKLNPK
jgi:hypothetical protein